MVVGLRVGMDMMWSHEANGRRNSSPLPLAQAQCYHTFCTFFLCCFCQFCTNVFHFLFFKQCILVCFFLFFVFLPFNDCQDVGLFVNSWTHETVFLFSEQSIKFANALLDTKHKSIRKKKESGSDNCHHPETLLR